jgi:hypothetical protein
MLLLEVDPANAIVNELDGARAANMRLLKFDPSSVNAADYDAVRNIITASQRQPTVVLENPPFGQVIDPETGEISEWRVGLGEPRARGYDKQGNMWSDQIDHRIGFLSLAELPDNGRAG